MKKKRQEIIFKNVTKYTPKNYNQFIDFHNKKYSFTNTSYIIIMSILLIYCIILNIIQKNIFFMLLFTVLLIGILFFKIYIPIKRYKKTQKKLSNIKEKDFTFLFYNWYLILDKKIIYYFNLYKIYETKDYFYLYVNPDYSMLVSKKGFEVGNSEDFSKFIKKKCSFKYKKAF